MSWQPGRPQAVTLGHAGELRGAEEAIFPGSLTRLTRLASPGGAP